MLPYPCYLVTLWTPSLANVWVHRTGHDDDVRSSSTHQPSAMWLLRLQPGNRGTEKPTLWIYQHLTRWLKIQSRKRLYGVPPSRLCVCGAVKGYFNFKPENIISIFQLLGTRSYRPSSGCVTILPRDRCGTETFFPRTHVLPHINTQLQTFYCGPLGSMVFGAIKHSGAKFRDRM